MFQRRENKKILIGILTACLIFVSVNQCTAQLNSANNQLCYGFIVTPVKYENASIQDQINCQIRHMINDLLRDQISIYWTTNEMSILIKKIDDTNVINIFFEKGTFVIPFTGDDRQDTKITTVIIDYNQSSEINTNNMKTILVYALMEQINIEGYPLCELKIAQHKSIVTIGEICFLEILRECGFLSFELIKDSVITERLNNNEFNVLLHAGGASEYGTFFKTGFDYTLFSDLIYRESTAVRKFVLNGGGYIGSCFGAIMAGSGHEFGPIAIHFKRHAYNPKLPSITFYCLADCIGTIPPELPNYVQVKIVNNSHPVAFNLDTVLLDFYGGGSGIDQVGENTQVIANYYNTSTYMDNTPSWISSTFGKGKVVAFSPHPEILAFYKKHNNHNGRTIISNALFYTTAKEKILLHLTYSRPFIFIEEIIDKTSHIPIDVFAENVFDEIQDFINEAIVELEDLNNYVKRLRDTIAKIADEKNIDLNEDPTFLGDKSFWIVEKYYFNLFFRYLENATVILSLLEKIYPLLENDSDFIRQVEALKSNLSYRLSEIRKICSQGHEMCKNYEEALLKYQQRPFILPKLKEFLLTDKGHKFYWGIYSEFIHIPHVYFDSLKFLRHHWYNYETNIALL